MDDRLVMNMAPIKNNATEAKSFSAEDSKEVRALFLRQAGGETAHDLAAIDGVLAHATPG
jgi:hypothetical protein